MLLIDMSHIILPGKKKINIVKKWLYFYRFEVPHDGFELIYDTKNPREV